MIKENVYIVHFPDKMKVKYKHILEQYSNKSFHKPDNIDIVIPITQDQIKDSYLIKQLNLSNYEYYNYLYDKSIVWEKEDKITYVLKSLKMCPNEYALVLDGNDVVITKDLDNLIKDFNTSNSKVVFNSELHGFLNGGVVFGKTKNLIHFYTIANDYLNKDKEKKIKFPSEQKYLLYANKVLFPDVIVDINSIIFQCIKKTE